MARGQLSLDTSPQMEPVPGTLTSPVVLLGSNMIPWGGRGVGGDCDIHSQGAEGR